MGIHGLGAPGVRLTKDKMVALAESILRAARPGDDDNTYLELRLRHLKLPDEFMASCRWTSRGGCATS